MYVCTSTLKNNLVTSVKTEEAHTCDPAIPVFQGSTLERHSYTVDKDTYARIITVAVNNKNKARAHNQ